MSDPIEDLLASIADGDSVDWESMTRGASAEKQRVDALRELAHIVEFNPGRVT